MIWVILDKEKKLLCTCEERNIVKETQMIINNNYLQMDIEPIVN